MAAEGSAQREPERAAHRGAGPVEGGVVVEQPAGDAPARGEAVQLKGDIGGVAVRLLDASDEFAAEVIATPAGDFRFFAAPGSWRLRALTDAGDGDALVAPTGAGLHEVDVKVA